MASEKLIHVVTDEFGERTSLFYEGRLTRHNGAELALSAINSFTVTLYCLDANFSIINGLDNQDAKNTGRGTINADGTFVIELQPEDMVIMDPRKKVERHRLLVRWSYDSSPLRRGARLVEFSVTNLVKVA